MAITITEIRNLTNTASDPITDVAKLKNFKPQDNFATTIINESDTHADWGGFAPNDNIQVTWNNGEKAVYRGVGGSIKLTGATTANKGIVTISGLSNASKYSVGLNGQIEIGPTPAEAQNPPVSVSVRIGNIPTLSNPSGDMLIDFSDKEDGAPGTSIELRALINWIQGQTGDSGADIQIPEVNGEDGKEKDLKKFRVLFNAFHFNITQKTFDFDVSSEDGDTITFGNFTIKKVGFRVTNEAVSLPVASVPTEEE
ncbi:hypothetical protein [uncultured Dokdonia sp.]|uniref:hypothetical protein n=1 Tax=uncultured Dokdonia sp. TaxID=575653 RepID=UPI002634B49F|nr:hypothetical protein [uncultured Dokdonia sp.]